jgi:multiple sugar transport system permease protein
MRPAYRTITKDRFPQSSAAVPPLATRGRVGNGWRFGLASVAPAVLLLIALSVFPTAYLVWASLQRYSLTSVLPATFIGAHNYVAVLGDSTFWTSLKVTGLFALSAVTAQLVIGFVVALLLTRLSHFQQTLATLLLLPAIISSTVDAFQWKQLFDYNSGVPNYLLRLLHLSPLTWTASPTAAIWSLLLVDFWEWTPFMTLLLFAGLKSLPQEVLEAARVDGSRPHHMLLYQVLPLMRRVIAIAVVLRLIQAFKVFDIIYVLTAGGPGTTTESLAYYNYIQAFQYFNVGYAAALAIVTLFIVIVLVSVILRYMEPATSQRSRPPAPVTTEVN